MRRTRILAPLMTLTLALHCALPAASEESGRRAPELALIPAPVDVQLRPGSRPIRRDWTIRVLDSEPSPVGVDELIQDAAICAQAAWTVSPQKGGTPSILIRSAPPRTDLKDWQRTSAYSLTISVDSIVIAASTVTGRFYGIQTLRQLLRASSGRRLPLVHISDFPQLQWRGVSDDISRGQASTMADFAMLLDHMSYYKLNIYFLYIEDMARLWSAPEVGIDRGALTPTELRQLVEAGRAKHVLVVPIFQTIGHQERLLASPSLEEYAEFQRPSQSRLQLGRILWSSLPALAKALKLPDPAAPPVTASCFAISEHSTAVRVKALIDEVDSLFKSPFFHLGGDEPLDLGKGRSRSAVRARGSGAVYADYANGLIRHVRRTRQRVPIIYSDVIATDSVAMRLLDRSTAIMAWDYEPTSDGTLLRLISTAGFATVFASPGLWNWFAVYPNYERAFASISSQARSAKHTSSAGLVVASWCDGGAESLRCANWLGYALTSEAGWSRADNVATFVHRYCSTEYGSNSPLLGSAIRLVGWQEFPTLGYSQRAVHRPISMQPRTRAWLTRMVALADDMDRARLGIATVLPTVQFNRPGVDVLDHAAARFACAGRREILLDQLARQHRDSLVRPESLRDLLAIRDSSRSIADRYAVLWTQSNRLPMLEVPLGRMRSETAALDSLYRRLSGDPRRVGVGDWVRQ